MSRVFTVPCGTPSRWAASFVVNPSIAVASNTACKSGSRRASAGPIEPFLTGFLDNNSYVGRPVDILVMKDGSVLVSDDWNGAVWRVSAGSGRTAAAR